MSEVRVRNLEPWVVSFLRDQARQAGNSLEGYLRERLREEAMRERREWAERLRAGRERLFDEFGLLGDSAAEIRQDREDRG